MTEEDRTEILDFPDVGAFNEHADRLGKLVQPDFIEEYSSGKGKKGRKHHNLTGLSSIREFEHAGRKVKIGRFPYLGNGKALALGEPEGMIKTIFDAATGELLGAHMVGAEVTELIQGFCVAKTLETTEAELMHAIFPHPTLSEMMHESVLDAYGRTIHF